MCPSNPRFHLLGSPRAPLPLTSAPDLLLLLPSSPINTRLHLRLSEFIPHYSSLSKSSSSVRSLPPFLLLCRGAPSVRRRSSFLQSSSTTSQVAKRSLILAKTNVHLTGLSFPKDSMETSLKGNPAAKHQIKLFCLNIYGFYLTS